jgi:hypothetical protein
VLSSRIDFVLSHKEFSAGSFVNTLLSMKRMGLFESRLKPFEKIQNKINLSVDGYQGTLNNLTAPTIDCGWKRWMILLQ